MRLTAEGSLVYSEDTNPRKPISAIARAPRAKQLAAVR
jgi:hypothetical protein